MATTRVRVCAGVDVGKAHHGAAVVEDTGATLWSQEADNDETTILAASSEILVPAKEALFEVYISGTVFIAAALAALAG
ncbi:hypothetical protein ACFWM1_26625 [Nocardia sp. NPDC058379]|uniref:hypothetical protein n=1 Tax=unclassified Nocardia TaxID=2637762 RepID=UPI00366428DC